MPIRERFRRALHKSESSISISQAESNTTTTNTSQSSQGDSSPIVPIFTNPVQDLSSSPPQQKLALSKTFTWGRDREKDEKKKEKRERKEKEREERMRRQTRKLHPSQRPLTLQNLQHQQMLSQFTMTFGASDPARLSRISFQEGVSPCCTRPPSIYEESTSAESSRDGASTP